jgi:hypothetical protein
MVRCFSLLDEKLPLGRASFGRQEWQGKKLYSSKIVFILTKSRASAIEFSGALHNGQGSGAGLMVRSQ